MPPEGGGAEREKSGREETFKFSPSIGQPVGSEVKIRARLGGMVYFFFFFFFLSFFSFLSILRGGKGILLNFGWKGEGGWGGWFVVYGGVE